jgi:ribonuclease BN (tRNA processing enzyme)
VKELILFHHDPDRNDEAVDQLLATARSRFPNSRAAYQGLEITL